MAPRQAPARFFEGAPEIVRRSVLDLIKFKAPCPLDFDVILRPEPGAQEVTGVDFGAHGARGQHFFLEPHEAREYRETNRRNRVAWCDLPEATRRAIVAYLES